MTRGGGRRGSSQHESGLLIESSAVCPTQPRKAGAEMKSRASLSSQGDC